MFFFFFVAQAIVNLFGAFGPEVGFDALWYHLVLPKLYLAAGTIYHVPGGLLYYSEMPRLMEILYIYLPAHFLSWLAGVGAGIVTYFLARYFQFDRKKALLAVSIFYVTPLVSWQSGSAYVDLARTFFEILALYLVLTQRSIVAGLAIGLAISTKTLALGSLMPLLLIATQRRRLLLVAAIVALPWFLSAYLNTGYPLYPIGAGLLDATHSLNFDLWNPPKVIGELWKVFVTPDDALSPIYFIVIPFLGPAIRNKKFIALLLYCFIALFVWYITPRTGGGRFILPYLPAFAILVAWTVSRSRFLLVATIFILCFNLLYRAAAISRLLPLFLGRETTTQYLCRNLDLKVNYVNCSGIKPDGLVLIKGYHNLYYVDFPFVHETWYRGEKYSQAISP